MGAGTIVTNQRPAETVLINLNAKKTNQNQMVNHGGGKT
jgi:hypothetical protein